MITEQKPEYIEQRQRDPEMHQLQHRDLQMIIIVPDILLHISTPGRPLKPGTNGTGVTTTTDSSKYSKMNLWEHRYRDRAVVSYNESSKMNNISVTTDGGWEIVYLPIKTEAGKKYKVTFDYRNPNGYNTYSTYEGIAYQALTQIENGDCFSYSLSEKKYLPKPVNNNTQQLELEFTATGTTTYFAINF